MAFGSLVGIGSAGSLHVEYSQPQRSHDSSSSHRGAGGSHTSACQSTLWVLAISFRYATTMNSSGGATLSF